MNRRSSRWFQFGYAALACWLLLGGTVRTARADGAMVMGNRPLFRVGPDTKRYCETASDECDSVLVKYLSGYSFLRGSLQAGLALTPPQELADTASFGLLHLDSAAAALPGGDMAVGSLDFVLARDQMLRLRFTLADLESVFACNDAQSGAMKLPFVGMVTSLCRGNSVLAADLRVLRLQWDTAGNLTEWFRLGPAFELLANGLGQAHLLRSVVIGVPFDLQSRLSGSAPRGTSLGLGLRLSALYRTPQWESRLRMQHRTALVSRAGFAKAHSFDAELRLLRNWFINDDVVVQTGISVGVDWASHSWAGQSLWASRYDRLGFQASLFFGWVNAPPAI